MFSFVIYIVLGFHPPPSRVGGGGTALEAVRIFNSGNKVRVDIRQIMMEKREISPL